MPAEVVWIIDTSSICEVRRQFQNSQKPAVFARLSALVDAGRLIYPAEVVGELTRTAADATQPDAQLRWAKQHAATANPPAKATLEEVKEILRRVSTILDPDKDNDVEEADPYILAAAVRLRAQGIDARIVTQERKDTPSKMSLNTAAGIVGVPSLPLEGLVHAENLLAEPEGAEGLEDDE